ncbi:OTU domain-containing protein [Acorus calamus]|uniref:OTU domain-containing protein n=1 Tax=Acorus calamus TaxID=4465 RepID=A0AAV9CKA5_ACOCL|nr:OTU domain-containing protein [Acorus calamus]
MKRKEMKEEEPDGVLVEGAPITVYMKNSDGLKIIAEYGVEYGSENPIRVLYHGYGHYDALQIPIVKEIRIRS